MRYVPEFAADHREYHSSLHRAYFRRYAFAQSSFLLCSQASNEERVQVLILQVFSPRPFSRHPIDFEITLRDFLALQPFLHDHSLAILRCAQDLLQCIASHTYGIVGAGLAPALQSIIIEHLGANKQVSHPSAISPEALPAALYIDDNLYDIQNTDAGFLPVNVPQISHKMSCVHRVLD